MSEAQRGYYDGANERIIARVPAGATRILDVGCAAGRLGEILLRDTRCGMRDAGWDEADASGRDGLAAGRAAREVWGIELVPGVAAEAKRWLDHVIVGDVEQMDPLPLPERYFDCAICGDVLEHLRDPEAFLARLRKHLVPGATLLANVPNIAHWSVIVGLLKGEFNYEDKGLLDRTHLHFFTPSSFRDLLWEAGYLVIEEEALSLPDGGASRAIGQAAGALGLDPAVAEQAAATYQHLVVARPVPDPYSEPEKMAALVGPHIGKLGPASKRCSVVILTYNSMKTIETCVESVLPTLGPDDELILVDNASQDGTPCYLEQIAEPSHSFGSSAARVQVILNSENLGFSKGCNIGMLASKGEYVILLNPDTRVWPGWIEGLLAPFQDSKVAAVGPLSDNVCGAQQVGLHLPPELLTSPEQIAAAVQSNPSQPAATKLLIGFCMALRRETLDRYGLLEEACVLGADDLEISWRLRTLGYPLAVARETFLSHRAGASFASIDAKAKRGLVRRSDHALISKMRSFYGSCTLPSSEQVWGNRIFAEALGDAAIFAGPLPRDSKRSSLSRT